MQRKEPTVQYHLEDQTNVHWPGVLPYRGKHSRDGYPTREAAEERARVVRDHYAAHYGACGGPDLRVVRREASR
jgi:hypothetical protein